MILNFFQKYYFLRFFRSQEKDILNNHPINFTLFEILIPKCQTTWNQSLEIISI